MARIVLSLLAAFGAYSGLNLSLGHFHTGDVCPMIGPVAACYLVFIGYVLAMIAPWIPVKFGRPAFWIGWTPVAGLATFGVVLELTQGDVCPKAGGVPQCFYSFALAAIVLVLWIVHQRKA